MSTIDESIRHAHTLLHEHAEKYIKEIVVEPGAWRRRFDELRKDLEWLEFVKEYPLPKP